MSDLIKREDVIAALNAAEHIRGYAYSSFHEDIMAIPAVNEEFEWCHDCKEYDQKKHFCPRWTKQIRKTVEEIEKCSKRDCNTCRNKGTEICKSCGVSYWEEKEVPYTDCAWK